MIIIEVVSLSTFIITMIQIFFSFYNRRVNLKAEVYHIETATTETGKRFIPYVMFSNKSKTSIAITNVHIVSKSGNKYRCELSPQYVGEIYYPKFPESDIPRTKRTLSAEFPIELHENGVSMKYMYFKLPMEAIILKGNNIELQITTNKKVITTLVYCQEVTEPIRLLFGDSFITNPNKKK